MQVEILTETQLRQVIQVDQDAIAAIEDAFTWLAQGRVSMPPIMHIQVGEQGDVDIKSAYVQGLDRFAVKIAAGFFNNAKLGLPNGPAMMVVLSAQTGMVEAVLLDNAYLTDVRTGAAGAVAAKYLAPREVTTAGVIGTGAQGRYQMMGLKQVRDFKRLLAFDQDDAQLARYVDQMNSLLDVEVVAAAHAEEVITQSQAVVTCTPSRKPYIASTWLHPGLHITAMGADLAEKQEIETAAMAQFDLLTCDRKSQCLIMGELHHAVDAGIISKDAPMVELGEITSGKKAGRRSEDQITLCDLTGTGVQDTAIAHLALERARRAGLGTAIELLV